MKGYKFKHDSKEFIEACGLTHMDIQDILKEMAIIGVTRKDGNSGVVEGLLEHTMVMKGDDLEKRIKLIHALAFQELEHIGRQLVKSIIAREVAQAIGGKDGKQKRKK